MSSAGISHWPFALKMAFCPALAMMMIVGMGVRGVVAVDKQAALVDAVVHHDVAIAMRLSESATGLEEINGRLYRLTTLQAIKTPGIDVAGTIGRLIAESSGLADNLESAARDMSAAEGSADVLRVVADIRLYRDAIDVFGSMLEIDFPSAVEFVGPFDGNAAKVLDQIKSIANRAILDGSNRAEISMHIADRIRLALIAAASAGFLLLFGTAALLTRATVGSVKRIAAATEKVAQGLTEVDVNALARGDELGTIVRSLAVFQANVSQIAFLAHHDPLTRLPNRILFRDRIDQALALLDRDFGFAVLCLGLDRFKRVNDTFGHQIGDELLRQVAVRLQACVREGDSVARLGGDEFAIVLLQATDPTAIDRLASRIIEAIGSGFDIDGQQISIGVTIGMALAPADGSTSGGLLKNAGTALDGAKASGRGTACFFEDSMNSKLQLRREIEAGLRQAIALDEFRLHYQPQVDARTRRVCGFEALIRWQHPEKGLISPDKFIPVAETSGLIGVIGQWVLRQACHDAQTWPSDIKIAVNLSPTQFREKTLVASVRDALATSGLAPNRLELEITESVLLNDSDTVMNILRDFKNVGVQISMDDFGTGYSSLSYLRNFPFDKVKIDQSFVRDLPNDQNALAIVRAIVGLSVTFGMSVTAEGVETEAQADQLELEKCNQLQGYLFSRAVPAANVPALIARLSAASSQMTRV